MKKRYVIPEIEIIDTELTGMLCMSTSFGGDADEAANVRMFDSDLNDWDE